MPGFSEDSARRVAEQVRRLERTPRSRVRPVAPPPVIQPPKYAVVATAITAVSGSDLRMGTATLQLITYAADGKATRTSMGQDVPVYHGGGSDIAAGRLIQVKVIDGRYNADVDYCP